MQVFSDLDQHNPAVLTDIHSIKQHILNILTTRKRSLIFRSDFGSNLEDYLFELMDTETSLAVLSEVTNAVGRWEPRVEVDFANSRAYSDPDRHTLWVELAFIVKKTGEFEKFTIGFAR